MKSLIQIGCNIGQDDVQELLTKSDTRYRVLLVDANNTSLDKCKESYRPIIDKHDIQFINTAIVADENISEIDFYIPQNDDKSVFCSANENHAKAHSHSDCEKLTVIACTLNRLFELHSLNEIEYLYVDTEGLCVDNLLVLDFTRFNVSTIVFEFIHSDGMLSYGGKKLDSLKELLTQQGYSLREAGYNIFATKNTNEQ